MQGGCKGTKVFVQEDKLFDRVALKIGFKLRIMQEDKVFDRVA